MARRVPTILRSFAVLLIALAFAGPAAALDLDAAKAQGLVGEQTDGYVGAVKSSPDVAKLVADVNAKRRAAYEELARKNGTPVEAVASLAGQKLIDRAPAGAWSGEEGRWYQKK
jgi:uncharacterized protein YdbL (DUF1318 family)